MSHKPGKDCGESAEFSMSDEAALLAAIRENPDEDTPRLVYADWLQENGQTERGEFIRLQCAAARLPDGEERRQKEKAAAALLNAHLTEWFGPLRRKFHHPKKPAVGHCRIDRGFITSIKGDVDDVLAQADAIATYAPCLREVEVRHVRADLAKLLAKPFVRRVAELRLATLHPESFVALKKHPAWGPLDVLELGFEFENESDTLAGLAEAPLVQAARRLDLQYGYFIEGSHIDEPDDAAAQAPSLREMRRLKIPHLRGFGIHGIDADSAAALAAWPPFKRLDWLNFSVCNIEDEAAATLLTSRNLPELARLTLNENDLGTATAEALAASRKLSRLTYLDLAWNNLRDADAGLLADSTTLPAALPMDVSFNRMTKRGLEALRERFGPGVVSRDQLG
jgi:uncharacterized protein (TIGR02996 family)